MRIVYLLLGFVFLIIGIIGVILPLIPGTVNLLIAAFFFTKSNPRMERWMLEHPHLGPPIISWRTDRSMTKKHKIMAISMMWVGIIIACFRAPWWGGLGAVLTGIYGAYYIATRKTRVETPPLPPVQA